MSEKDFKFYMPLELTKGEKEEDQWEVKGIASTPDEDLQGETVDQNGLDISMLKAGRGVFNWDHQKGPENILGQIEDADFIEQEGKKCLMVKGYLFKHQERSKAFYNILKSLKKGAGPRVHLSIEGKILQRDFANNKAIKKARIDKVALTMDPVNPYTYAELVKSLATPDPIVEEPKIVEPQVQEDEIVIKKAELEKILEFANKALSAGAGYLKAPAQRTGGEAMSRESLEGSPKNMTYGKKKKKDKKAMLKSLMKSLREIYPQEDPMTLAELAIETVIERFDEGE